MGREKKKGWFWLQERREETGGPTALKASLVFVSFYCGVIDRLRQLSRTQSMPCAFSTNKLLFLSLSLFPLDSYPSPLSIDNANREAV
jgi:hypothetical protein